MSTNSKIERGFGAISFDNPFVTLYSNRNKYIEPEKPKIRPFPSRKGK